MRKKARARESARAPSLQTIYFLLNNGYFFFFLIFALWGGGGGRSPPRENFRENFRFLVEKIITFVE